MELLREKSTPVVETAKKAGSTILSFWQKYQAEAQYTVCTQNVDEFCFLSDA